MEKINFKELPSNPIHGGIQYVYLAENGYGASIVKHSFSYGNDQGLWELAVLGKDGSLTYDIEITDDVLGYLSEEDVNETLLRISKL